MFRLNLRPQQPHNSTFFDKLNQRSTVPENHYNSEPQPSPPCTIASDLRSTYYLERRFLG